jgi:hypothetical protein
MGTGLATGLGITGAVVGGMFFSPWLLAAAIGGVTGAAVGSWLGSSTESTTNTASTTPTTAPLTTRVFPADPLARGGRYGDVKLLSAFGIREADHVPPKSTYKGTPYATISENDMPAVSIPYSVHRLGQSGSGKGVTTTGSSRVVVQYREEYIRENLKKKDFKSAMIVALNDQKNAAPNTLNLVTGQREAAEYARSIGLLKDDLELAEVIQAIERITY